MGEVLRGDRIQISDYELVVGKDETCRHLCDRKVNRGAVERAKELVRGGYVVEWWVPFAWRSVWLWQRAGSGNKPLTDKPHRIVDNLPGATSFVTVDKTKKYYAAGFKLGFYENDVSPTLPLAVFIPQLTGM